MFNKYDVIVVGAGHAGCEAAAAAANLGSKVLLITMNMQTIAQMSCNPAMGGIAKGQIVREIDALGGYSGIVTDSTLIQFRMLNKSKGPAMWSPRAQSDRTLFSIKWREMLENTINIDFYQDSVSSLIIKNSFVCGVITSLGHEVLSKTVVITSGTFLNGVIHIGEKKFGGGRMAEKASTGITEQLVALGFESNRLKTGTPPRVDGRSLDYSKMEEQKGDDEIVGFSYSDVDKIDPSKQKSCYITYTNQDVHDTLKTGFDKSPMYQGRIGGVGPRYCPSIEDKINRFADKSRHQLFVEPEGFNTIEIYVNGFSTSLPEEVQFKALRMVPGFENCKMFRPGYAIEYDYFPPTQLTYSLETKLTQNLFFAGQINGTTGYEEAACQGIMAGINAHQKAFELEPFVLKRSEPYRMFTSRAEYRTLLRQDNADLRLTQMSYKLGLASQQRMEKVRKKEEGVKEIKTIMNEYGAEPEEINLYLEGISSAPIHQKQKLSQLLLRPDTEVKEMIKHSSQLFGILGIFPAEYIEQAEIQIKYDTYINKEKELVERMSQLEELIIPNSFNYEKIISLSNEARQKFNKIRPSTLGQASRISGVNPSDVQILMVYMGR